MDGQPPRPTVFVVAKALGLDERAAAVPSPFVCRLLPTERGGTVTCTPDIRLVELTLVKQAGALELSRSGGAPKQVPIPAGTDVVIARSEKSSRDLPGAACPAGQAARAYDVPFLNQLDATNASRVSVMVPNADRSRIQLVQLLRNPSAARCRAEGTDRARHVRCEGVPSECDVRIDGASVELECTGSAPGSGRVLLPCGADARLPTNGLIVHVPAE